MGNTDYSVSFHFRKVNSKVIFYYVSDITSAAHPAHYTYISIYIYLLPLNKRLYELKQLSARNLQCCFYIYIYVCVCGNITVDGLISSHNITSLNCTL